MSFVKQAFVAMTLLVTLTLTIVSCSKDSYNDTGLANAKFDGTILQYLQSKPLHFDTLASVIKLAGMEPLFNDANANITFFAPPDPTIGASIKQLNLRLLNAGRDTISKLEDIKPAAWRNILSLYTFKGTNRLKDYPQVDTLALDTYAGQSFVSYAGIPINIGVIFNDAVSGSTAIKYAGYRQLMISYIPDWSNPKRFWINTLVSSSDINPKNGIVHALKFRNHAFGFHTELFISIALQEGIGN